MKKFLQTAGGMVGGGMMGFSAGRLDRVSGIAAFIGGVVLLVLSINIITRPEKCDEK